MTAAEPLASEAPAMGPATGIEGSTAAAGGCTLYDLNACVPDDIDISPLMEEVNALAEAASKAASQCLNDGGSICNTAQALADEAVRLALAAADDCANNSGSLCQQAIATAVLLADVVVSLGLGCVNGEVALCRDTVEAAFAAADDALQAAGECLGDDGSLCQQALWAVADAADEVEQLVLALVDSCLNDYYGLCQGSIRTAEETADLAADVAGDAANECLNNYYGLCQATLRLVLDTAAAGLRGVQDAAHACLNDSSSVCKTILADALAAAQQAAAAAEGAIDDLTVPSTPDAVDAASDNAADSSEALGYFGASAGEYAEISENVVGLSAEVMGPPTGADGILDLPHSEFIWGGMPTGGTPDVSNNAGAEEPTSTDALMGACAFAMDGDRVHISSSKGARAAQGHGWWESANCKGTATVTVWLQVLRGDDWVTVGRTGTYVGRQGRGRGKRATARSECTSTNSTTWRSEVDVDHHGGIDSPRTHKTPAVVLNCAP